MSKKRKIGDKIFMPVCYHALDAESTAIYSMKKVLVVRAQFIICNAGYECTSKYVLSITVFGNVNFKALH
jgi:hypothetical protein